ncbi:class I SAM-dependent methyltransferase [Fulvivirgaceae bacterium BMA10]|uniref:Class I SAM-dependent methyltransferase n=1 Tax=Splendidivirga corallicola TaxID=3051826 RepID=A0ABT8KPQ3_9BACT|nr:class I SAM-dependent methyltransferase [Fulvivirgaceae bacterium BMA10]
MVKAEKFWDRVSKQSDKPTIKLSPTSLKTIESAIKYLKPDDVILDFGCGSGTITSEIAYHVKEIQAIDISFGMIEVAKKKVEQRKIENIDFTQSTILNKRFNEKSFDVILAFNVLHFIEDKQQIMQRINNLLKPEGLFISATVCLGERMTFLKLAMFLLTKLGMVPTMNFYKTTALEGMVTNGNFKIVESKKISGLPECFIVAKKIS